MPVDAAPYGGLSYVFQKSGITPPPSPECLSRFDRLYELLLEGNARHNLTAITDREGADLRHFADSAAAARYLPVGAEVLDIGCGAGFPTLPLAILRPDLHITAMDATEKKVRFVAETAAALGLSNVRAMAARAEEAGRGEMRESFSVVTARAVSELRVLAELCLPFVRIGGLFLVLKGQRGDEEWEAAKKAIGQLGGRLEGRELFTLSNGQEELTRTVFLVRKVAPTPPPYPRAYARILKKPL